MPSICDPSSIRRILETDRAWAVYALGDLSPRLYPHCAWFCRAEGEPAVVLLCRAFATPVLFTLGETSAVKRLLDEIGEPREIYLHVRPEIVPIVAERYGLLHKKSMWRMVLAETRGLNGGDAKTTGLGPADLPALQELYADGDAAGEAPDFFLPWMLEEGVFFGVWEGDGLAAAAGTHLVVPAEGVAAIGNVYTRRDRRGRGLGESVMRAVTRELQRLRLRTIALNVEQRNAAAIRLYERLGFVRYCAFHEALAVVPDP
jgi:ribosomal protein S18 acetylase RimI-like enzyme